MRRRTAAALAVAAAVLAGCSSTSPADDSKAPAKATTTSSTSTVASSSQVPATSAPARTPRFSDSFVCTFGEPAEEYAKTPVLSGPSFCDDPVVRAAETSAAPWFADPGNGRPCLVVDLEPLEASSVLTAECQEGPAEAERGAFCDTMRSLEGEVAAESPDRAKVAAGLEVAASKLSPGDAREWVDALLGIWREEQLVDMNTTLLNINGFSYAEITCGFSYERIGDPPSAPATTVPEPDPGPPMEIDDEAPPAGTWIALLASVPIEDKQAAISMAGDWSNRGLVPVLIDSRDFESLNDPYWVLALTGFADEFEVNAACEEIIGSPAFTFVPDCQPRQL